MENGEDFNDHYSYLEILNATPYNYYMAHRSSFQLHLQVSNRGSALYTNCPSTSTAAAQNEIAASQDYEKLKEGVRFQRY